MSILGKTVPFIKQQYENCVKNILVLLSTSVGQKVVNNRKNLKLNQIGRK